MLRTAPSDTNNAMQSTCPGCLKQPSYSITLLVLRVLEMSETTKL
uniref:Uncharacterized protein n=1 Tax=Arundo donax TaxID=35708 RepID=A0A0A9GUK8_ARUDO